jgi:hypothetical protein
MVLKRCLKKSGQEKIYIHLLISAYRSILIAEPLDFLRELFSLTVHGYIYNSRLYVWLNLLVESRGLSLDKIRNLAAFPSRDNGIAGNFLFSVLETVVVGVLVVY